MSKKAYFLPYQERWLRDTSRMKIAKKSRRIGWTYVQAYEDMLDAAKARDPMDVWFSSADLSAAREYIRYVEMWAKLFKKAAEYLGEVVIDKEDDIKAFCIEFSSGKRVYALSSNPKAFRSKGGKVILDEFALHEDQDALMQAAGPSITWGYPIRVFSSPKGKNNRFFQMCEAAQKPGSKWSFHQVTIEDAIADGLLERILKIDRPATDEEIANFLAECRETVMDEEAFLEEYMCQEQEGMSVWIPHELISLAESDDLPQPVVIKGSEVNKIWWEDYQPDEWDMVFDPKKRYFLGVDIGRDRDLTVMWLYEEDGSSLITRLILELHQVKFRHQYKHLDKILKNLQVRAAAIDRTGMGRELAENAQDDYGEWRVEAVNFTLDSKQDMSVDLKNSMEDGQIRIPKSDTIRADFRQIKKVVTENQVKFMGERTKNGHADRYWGAALGRRAYSAPRGPVEYTTVVAGRYSDDSDAYQPGGTW
jgi:phage FluMu gp28-like protein